MPQSVSNSNATRERLDSASTSPVDNRCNTVAQAEGEKVEAIPAANVE